MSESDFSVRVENLGKRYNLGDTVSRRRVFNQAKQALRNSVSGMRHGTISSDETVGDVKQLWAVQDVSFELAQGEVLGLIGPNGAGKSTLLKLLCQITAPTTGRILLQGRVGALLEVGAGFKAMLSGLENIYLQGAWLGMRKKEIESKIDEIIDFSGLQGFLDTPVKRYSSGMRLRLAFSVAAHLNPEIVIIDEALAVGDAGFRQKCIVKLTQIAQSGRTVIFVSHIPELIISLCTRVIWLEDGKTLMDGIPSDVMHAYAESGYRSSTSISDLQRRHDRTGSGILRITHIKCEDKDKKPITHAVVGKPLRLILQFETQFEDLTDLTINITLRNNDGIPVLFLSNAQVGQEIVSIPVLGQFICEIERMSLIPGGYNLDLEAVLSTGRADMLRNAHRIEVAPGPFFDDTTPVESRGVFFTNQKWAVEDV